MVFFSFPIKLISDGIVDSLIHNENIEMTRDFIATVSIYLYRAMPASSSSMHSHVHPFAEKNAI